MTIGFPSELAWLGVIIGMEWPEGDEDSLRRIATAWNEAAAGISQLSGDLESAARTIQQNMSGQTGESLDEAFRQLISGDLSPDRIAEAARNAADMSDNTATSIEYTKISFYATLVITAAQIAWALALAVETLGTSLAEIPVAEAIAQTAVRIGLRELLQKIAEWVGKEVVLRAVKGAVTNALLTGVQDAAIQGYQIAAGGRKSFDDAQFRKTVELGAVGGAGGALAGGAAEKGLSKLAGRSVDNIAGLGQRWAAKATVGATDGGVNALTSGIYANQRYGDPLNPKAVVGGFLSGGLTANPGRGPQADGGHGGEGGETGRPGSRPAANGDGGGRSAGTRSGTTPTPGGPRPDSATPPSGTGGASRSAGESSGTQPGTSNSVRPESDSSTGRSATASESSASGADSGVRAETRTSPVPLADTTSHQPLVETPTSAPHTETVPVETPHQTGENPTDAPQSGSGVQGVHGSQPGESSPPTSGAPTPGPPTSHVSEASSGPAAESIPPSTSDSGQARSVPAATTTASADTSTPASQSAAPPTGTSSTTHAPTHGRVDAPTAESSAPNRDSPGGRADPPAPRTESVPTRQDAAPARQEAAPVRQDSAPARQDSGPARHESSTDRPHVKGDNPAAPRSERPAPHSSGPRHAAPDQHRTGDGAGESRLPLDQPSHDTSAPDRPKADQPSGAEQRGDTDGHPAQDLPRENDSTPRSDTRDAEGGREIPSEDRRDAATGPVDRAVSETLSSAEHDESSSVQHRSEETVCSDADWSAADVAAALALPTSHGVVSEGAQTHQPRTQGLSGSTGGGRRENGDTASRSAPHRAPEYEGGGGEGSRAGGDDGSGRPPVDADGASSASAPRPDVPADLYRAAEARGFQRNEIHDLLHRLAEAGALDHQGNRVLEGAGREHLDRLSSHEIDALLALRDSNPLPDLTHDPIRKVVSGRQLDAIFDQARDGTEFAPGRDPAGVGGCVSATVDVDSRMRTPLEIDEGLRLDYDGSPFNRLGPHDPVYVIDGHVELGEGGAINRLDRDLLDEASRRDPQMTFDDPHSSRLAAGDPPHTGVGYPGSDRVLTPEYEISGDARYVDGAEVKRINPDGSSDVMARLIDGDQPRWIVGRHGPPHRRRMACRGASE